MPLLAVARLSKRLSVYFYSYGKKCASRTYLLLALSLSFITFFSYPVIQKTFQIDQPTIPLADLDAQIWQSSIHVQFHNFTLFRRLPSSYLITQQVRISQPNNEVDFELIKKATSIYESIATTIIDFDTDPVSLSTICYRYFGRCLVYRPHYRDEHDFLTSIHDKPNERHPFTSFANVSLDSQGRFLRADAVLLTFVLKQQHAHTLRIWNTLWDKTQSKLNMMDINHSFDPSKPIYAQAQIIPHMVQYKFKLIPYDLPYQAQLSIVAYIVVFFLVSTAFGKSNLVRSGPIFGVAAIFLSTACFTTTWGIFERLGVELSSAPWFLLLFTVNVASLENVFLLTHAILYAGCDMVVVEKISRGLQSVGVPMTTTLIAELLILHIGKAMDSDVIKEFCLFSEVALIVDYILGMTFVISILSIDIKRVELTDLDDRKMSKRLHELAKCEVDATQEPDFCPVQDTLDKIDAISCADCKDFKTHRAFNSLMLCLIVLGLSLFCSRSKENILDALSPSYIDIDQPDLVPIGNTHSLELNTLANRFWAIVNPDKSTLCLQIQPPYLIIYPTKNTEITLNAQEFTTMDNLDSIENKVQSHLNEIQAHYDTKSKLAKSKYNNEKDPPSLLRMFIFNMLQNALVFILGINIPSLLLCLVMIAIIIWMTPTWREQWLMPFIKRSFEQSIHALIRILPFKIVKMFFFKGATQNHPVVTKSLEYEPDGIQHRGAITVQNMFNQQQYRTNVKQVRIKTLSHQHTADVYQIDANTKNSIVSFDHDGKIILWDAEQSKWMARLDKMIPLRGMLQAYLNPEYFENAVTMKGLANTTKSDIKKKSFLHKQQTSKLCCIKVDPSNRWVAAGYANGMLRIWNIHTGMLVRELNVYRPPVQVQHETSQEQLEKNENSNMEGIHIRFSKQSSYESHSFLNSNSTSANANRTLHLQFIGAVTEYCHPIVAEAAARCKLNDGNSSQSYLVSVHKGGIIHEWDIVSSECVQTIHTGHTRDITQLHVVDSRAPHRKLGITWVFTASKDGLVKCFERYRLNNKNTKLDQTKESTHQGEQYYEQYQKYDNQQKTTQWELIYTIDLSIHGAVTSIATELPVGGMGVLVTGSRDGTVKVWNFETGEALTTLSVGRYQRSSATSSEYTSASSLRNFSRFPPATAVTNLGRSKSLGLHYDEFFNNNDFLSSNSTDTSEHNNAHSLITAASADHHSSIQQVVVTRYCEVENGPGVCRACDTCFGNGFLIASSSADNEVHAWRLERSDNSDEVSCTLCTKDYHRKQYRHRKTMIPITEDNNNNNPLISSTTTTTTTTRRRRRSLSNSSPKKIVGHARSVPKYKPAQDSNNNIELLDIEQLAGDSNIPLASSFLGVINQPAGYGLVFCDKILAGVRRISPQQQQQQQQQQFMENDTNKKTNEWEVWFASLQYYEPTANDNSLLIPIETFNLDNQTPETNANQHDDDTYPKHSTRQLKEALQGLFNSSSTAYTKFDSFKYKHIHHPSNDSDEDEDDVLEAGEILPFSSIRRVISLDGSGLACDFGNFVKLVYLDRPSSAQKEQMRLIQHSLKKTENNTLTTVKETDTQQSDECLKKGQSHCCGVNRICCNGNI